MTLKRLLNTLIPRFVTEDAAAVVTHCGHCDDEHPQPVCAMSDVRPGEVFDGIMTMRSFRLFGRGLFPSFDGEMRPWKNPHDQVRP